MQITADDLAFDTPEAEALMAAAGVDLGPEALAEVLRRTEGWPAGLRLAALRIGGRPDPAAAARAFAGDDRTVADYLHEVMLAGLPPETLTFLTRTAVLEPSAGTCATRCSRRPARRRGSRSSSARTSCSSRSTPTASATATTTSWATCCAARCAGGSRRSCEELHRRASAWHEAARDAPAAVRHALAAGDRDRAADLVWAAFPAGLTRGAIGDLQAMLASFGIDDVVASAPLAIGLRLVSTSRRAASWPRTGLSLAERAAAPPGGTPESAVAGDHDPPGDAGRARAWLRWGATPPRGSARRRTTARGAPTAASWRASRATWGASRGAPGSCWRTGSSAPGAWPPASTRSASRSSPCCCWTRTSRCVP